jgi:hypothetical protein
MTDHLRPEEFIEALDGQAEAPGERAPGGLRGVPG